MTWTASEPIRLYVFNRDCGSDYIITSYVAATKDNKIIGGGALLGGPDRRWVFDEDLTHFSAPPPSPTVGGSIRLRELVSFEQAFYDRGGFISAKVTGIHTISRESFNAFQRALQEAETSYEAKTSPLFERFRETSNAVSAEYSARLFALANELLDRDVPRLTVETDMLQKIYREKQDNLLNTFRNDVNALGPKPTIDSILSAFLKT